MIGDEFLMASQASSTPVAQARRRAASANKRARDDEVYFSSIVVEFLSNTVRI